MVILLLDWLESSLFLAKIAKKRYKNNKIMSANLINAFNALRIKIFVSVKVKSVNSR